MSNQRTTNHNNQRTHATNPYAPRTTKEEIKMQTPPAQTQGNEEKMIKKNHINT